MEDIKTIETTEAAAAAKTEKAKKPKKITESWEDMQKRHKEESKALRKQMAAEKKKENSKFTSRMVAAVRAYHKGMSDEEIMNHYKALVDEKKAAK